MPRLSSQLPRYRKHASGQAFVYLDGRNIYLGPYRSLRSRQEYDRVIGEWIANGRHLPPKEGTMPHLPAIVADMVKLQRLTGARPDEICAMRPVDIDQTQSVWIYRPPHHKNTHRGKLLEIPIGPRGQELLRPYLLRAPAMFCFSPNEAVEQWMRLKRQSRQSKVQPRQRDRNTGSTKRRPGNRYTTASYRRAIHRGCVKSGIPQWSPNQLRHSAATQARREYGLEATQALLSHSNANTTQIYAERNLKLAAEVAQKLG